MGRYGHRWNGDGEWDLLHRSALRPPVVAAVGFLVSVGALALVVGAVWRSWSALRSSGFVIVVPILAALGLSLEMVAPLGCACF